MAKMKKIRKWDEVTGNAVEEQIPESIDPIEDVGAGLSISRNHMRGIEDMVEQNDNSFDGIINNVPAAPVPDFAEINEKADQEDIMADTKASVMEKIKEQVKELILERLNIIKPAAKADASDEIDQFIDWWKLRAAQEKPLRYYVVGTERYNRLMNPYDKPHVDTEKPTLQSMREVESSANMYYYTED